MARRSLPESAFRQVTRVVAENPTSVLNEFAQIGQQILQQNEEAKVTENFSQLQLDLGQAELEYKTEFAADPVKGFNSFKQRRQKLIDSYSENISPLFRGQWNDSVRSLTARSDATQQKWVYTQARRNSISFVNTSMENSVNQAMRDGMAAGENDEEDIDAFVNFADSYQNIEKFAVNNLGEAEAGSVLKNYEQDYIKSFVSGVSFSNPEKALDLLNDEDVQKAFAEPDQYIKMRDAVTRRVDRKQKADFQRRDAEVLSGTNALAGTARNMNYAELQQVFDQMGVSKEAQEFYMDASGYTSKKRALTRGEKSDLKNKFYITMTDFIENEKVTTADMKAFQALTYGAMTKGALSKGEGFALLNNLMEPLLAAQKERADQFETGEWNPFQDNLGFDTLKDEAERLSGFADIDPEELTEEQFFNVNRNKNLMYDAYIQSLGQQAQERNVSVAELGDIGRSEEIKIYNKALNDAKGALFGKNFPSAPEGANTVVQTIFAPSLTEADIDKMTEEELDRFLAKSP